MKLNHYHTGHGGTPINRIFLEFSILVDCDYAVDIFVNSFKIIEI